MVRTFLKHCEEVEGDEELASVHRDLYDYMLALGPSVEAGDTAKYLRLAKKKLGKLRRACELFHEIQPEVSGHTNFCNASHSLRIAVERIGLLIESDSAAPGASSSDLPSSPNDHENDEDDSE